MKVAVFSSPGLVPQVPKHTHIPQGTRCPCSHLDCVMSIRLLRTWVPFQRAQLSHSSAGYRDPKGHRRGLLGTPPVCAQSFPGSVGNLRVHPPFLTFQKIRLLFIRRERDFLRSRAVFLGQQGRLELLEVLTLTILL